MEAPDDPKQTPEDPVIVKSENVEQGPLILVTDIDGTFARGAPGECAPVHQVLLDRPHSALVYVTSRAIESARAYQQLMGLPRPDVFVAERGSSVALGHRDAHVEDIDGELDRRWPGAGAVRRDLEPIGDYLDELPITGPRRLAYVPPDAMSPPQLADMIATSLTNTDVDVVQTGDGCVDVVPKNVTSGFTVDRVLEWIGAEPEWVVVAADTLRHADLFRPGRRGIVVAGADLGLKDRVARQSDVYMAKQDGAAGVLEGLKHFGYVAETTGVSGSRVRE
jgi:hydroxymethylpyrimidine pyrophosphatase-like HAD family hydrolase